MIARDHDDDLLVDAEALSVHSRLRPDTIKRQLTAVACDLATRRSLYSSRLAEQILALIKPRTRRGK